VAEKGLMNHLCDFPPAESAGNPDALHRLRAIRGAGLKVRKPKAWGGINGRPSFHVALEAFQVSEFGLLSVFGNRASDLGQLGARSLLISSYTS
jgi:hypothetical protein